jgi:cobalt-zinc-cadmium efflux system membrane fusion protein
MKERMLLLAVCSICLLMNAGCKKAADPKQEAPPRAELEKKEDVNLLKVAHPDQFPLVSAVEHEAAPELRVTGAVTPDISREIPVISLANGRVVNIKVRLGDTVHKGQSLMQVESTDVASAFSAFLKAQNDERLARIQLERTQVLFDKGANSKSQLEIAENNEQDATATLVAADQQLRLLGVDKNHPSALVEIRSPASGVIIAQNVTNASAAGTTLSGSPNAFMIADLSRVWVICDVYENDLAIVHLGQPAEIRLDAYPGKVLKGHISDIGSILDPNLRTAKVRVELENPGNVMRVGMFVNATFFGKSLQKRPAIPASAILHLQDRDWVYAPIGQGQFRRIEVRGGAMLPGNLQEVTSGLNPGQQVVQNALELQNATGQQ